jgi:nitrite reductase/ring-hydroxylating ferredoxin subunit/uncharacterized membrane protein
MDLHRLVARVGRLEQLDAIAAPVTKLVKRAVPPKSLVKDVLSGTWLGHPLHPMLTDIPIGSFTSANVLDLIGGRASQRAADRLVDLGLVSAVATAAAGAADWSDTYGEEQRIGVVHAASNLVGVALYAASAVARRRGARGRATMLGLAGTTVMTVGGYLGGHLGWVHGVGVNNAFTQHPPSEWTDVLALDELDDGASRRVDVDGATVLLHRDREDVLAIGSRCSHAGGPLEEGDVDRDACTVTCPWHQSVFSLESGAVVHGPATVPQVAYDTRVTNGRVEIRARR